MADTMDNWQIAQNYIVAAALAGTVGGYYYYTSKQRKPNRTGSSGGLNTKRSETDLRVRRNTRDKESLDIRPASTTNGAVKKRKAKPDVAAAKEEVATPVRDEKPAKESDISTAAFAQQMLQARQGANLTSSKAKQTRVKTVKPRILPAGSPSESVTETNTDAGEEETHDAGDVSDMLEARGAAPATLRITASEKPQTQRAPRQQKQEVVETKKQRQNRKKIEERKALREADERDRKALEERQRRAAREARGEPAKNGVSKPPQNSAWEQRNTNAGSSVQAPASTPQLLDTFDAESTSSSTGGLEASTAATSTTEGDQTRFDGASEEDQMATALQQSSDESGWTTIAMPKKAKKQPSTGELQGTTGSKQQKNNQAKSRGFSALDSPDDVDA